VTQRVYDLLVHLATDPAISARFRSLPDEVLDQAGLDGRQREAIASRDPELIWDALDAEVGEGTRPRPSPVLRAGGETGEGSLTIVGSGIQLVGHITLQARACIEQADKVLHGVGDPGMEAWITNLNPTAQSLDVHYEPGKKRRDVYQAMVEEILSWVRRRIQLCVVFYGHPGILVYASHEAMNRSRAEGFGVMMLPGISAADCLIADLGLDLQFGFQSYEATRFLLFQPCIDPSVPLVLWQVGSTGETRCVDRPNAAGIRSLAQYLQRLYPAHHEVVLYEAAQYPVCDPVIERVTLTELATAQMSLLTTLYVPPARSRSADLSVLPGVELPL
jgi:uncharacterized protein YabN with tetrapyrrole methylase and pyrophosphatase domain